MSTTRRTPGRWTRASLALLLAVGVAACAPRRRASDAAGFEALPERAFRVKWAPVLAPTTLRPGESCRVPVTFTNVGPVAWPANGLPRLYNVRLAHRWLRGVDGVLHADYGNHRVELPAPVAPGASVTLEDTLVAPSAPGDYVVQFDLVQSGVAWFASRGAALKLVLVKVQ